MADNTKKTKKKGAGLGWLIFVAIIAISNLADSDVFDDIGWYFRRLFWRIQHGMFRPSDLGEGFIPIVIAVAVFVLVFVLARAAKKKKDEVEMDRPTAARTSAAVRRPDPRTRSFTQPDAYCFTCDHSGEDHFQRDRQTRIRQLDDWLKNGLIDREEYKVLKARFEHDL